MLEGRGGRGEEVILCECSFFFCFVKFGSVVVREIEAIVSRGRWAGRGTIRMESGGKEIEYEEVVAERNAYAGEEPHDGWNEL